MKKLVSAVLIFAMLLCLCACGDSKPKTKTDSSSSQKVSSDEDITVSDYTPSDTESEIGASAKSVTRYFIYGPGKKLKFTYDVDYSVEGTITINIFDKNNYKTGSRVYDYDENGLIAYAAVKNKDGEETAYTTYEYNNLLKVDSEYYFEDGALRSTTRYTYDENGLIKTKTVEKVGDSDVYKWDYARDGGALYAIYISTDKAQNVEGYTFANNTDGKLYQKYHMVNGFTADYYMYDYDGDGRMNYRGYYDSSNSLVEYYSFKYGAAPELAAKAFANTGILD